MRPLVIGTRGSALALAQVELVKQALSRVNDGFFVEVRKITTSGDRRQDVNAWRESGAGLKGMFTKEIEDALLAGEIDVAVHSCKDLPGHLANGCVVRAVLERAATDDVLISKNARSFSALPARARIATSSVRRHRQLLGLREDLHIEEMRGNVPTRLRKLRDSDSLDAIVLARAGLERLGYRVSGGSLEFEDTQFSTESLPTLPAIGQGAIALECRADDAHTAKILEAINHMPTFQCIRAERELLRLLDGDCRLPVGAKTRIDGSRLRMSAIVFDERTEPRVAESEGDVNAPEELAERLFKLLYAS